MLIFDNLSHTTIQKLTFVFKEINFYSCVTFFEHEISILKLSIM